MAFLKVAMATAFAVALALPVHAADSDSEDFIGIYHTPEVFECDIEKAGAPIKATRYILSVLGRDYESTGFDYIFDTDGAIDTAEGDLKEKALGLGYNAVISTQYIINQSADAVYESGKNWMDGQGLGYDHTIAATVFLIGIPVTLDC